MRQVTLKSGDKVPVLGLGTWRMGERKSERAAEVAAIRLGIDLGIRLVDTAEMYGEGVAEEEVAEAIAGRRDELFLVSKVYPHNASRSGAIAACERSLKRLKTDRLDLYLLHWRGAHPLAETVEAFEALKKAGKIRNWGVSNLDSRDMEELARVPHGAACSANQVLYHLGSRGIEWRLLEQCRQAGVMVMAYSPLGQGPLLRKAALKTVAQRHGVDPGAVALAWVLRQPGVVTIPKAVKPEHVRANLKALEVKLDADDLKALDAAFPPPKRAEPLDMT
ncbi:MAG TPA: aldo/keto reductase [Hyphomicrobiaceae bacterium]|jgi:diketogulonate reductase-like aldo/keto reductase|nr:aldo/keto reductase [Hyphomicrobiaceae bacterium]